MDEQPAPRVFEALSRYRWSSLVIVLVTVAVSLGVATVVAPDATAVARMALKAPAEGEVTGVDIAGSDITSEAGFVRYVKQRALFVTADRTLRRARDGIGGHTPLPELREHVTAEPASTGESVTVTVTADDDGRARRLADAVVSAYRALTRSDVRDATSKALDAIDSQRSALLKQFPQGTTSSGESAGESAAATTLTTLDKRADAIRVAASQFGDGVTFADKATVVSSGPGASLLRDGAIGLVVGLLLAATVAWLRADRNRTVTDAVDSPGDLPPLGEIEAVPAARLAELTAPTVPLPSYRTAQLALQTAVSEHGVVVLAGACLRSGTTVSVLQLGVAAAWDGRRVLLVDAATAPGGLSDSLGFSSGGPGLAAVTAGMSTLQASTQRVDLGGGIGMDVVPATAGTRGRFVLQSATAEKLVTEMLAGYDLVLVDVASMPDGADAGPLIRAADGVVLVVRRGTTVEAVRSSAERLLLLRGHVLGQLLTCTVARGDPA